MLDLAHILITAAESEFGIAVATSDSHLLRTKLYAARKNFPQLPPLAFIIPPVNAGKELWILKRE